MITSRRERWTGLAARIEEGRRAFKILTGKPTGKRPLGRPRRRRKDNITMNLKEIVSVRGSGLIRLRIWLLESAGECDIEPPGFISPGVSLSSTTILKAP